MRDQSSDSQSERGPRKDWFGILFNAVAGILATFMVGGYQLYSAQRDVAAAEIERLRGVKQSVVAIVEEQALNGKRLDLDRIARLIAQRRREEAISLPIDLAEVVQSAEFSIASSRHLSVDTKEEIKGVFDAFYAEQRARTFQPAEGQLKSTQLINEVAKQIQDGQPADALETLKILDEQQRNELNERSDQMRFILLEAVGKVVKSPKALVAMLAFFIVYMWLASRVYRRLERSRRMRRIFSGG